MKRRGNGEQKEKRQSVDDRRNPLDFVHRQIRHPPKSTDARQNPQLQTPTNSKQDDEDVDIFIV